MNKFILLIPILLAVSFASAQGHTYNVCCRYSKAPVTGDGCICPGCKKERDAEKAAIAKEDKRKEQEATAKLVAEKAKKERESKEVEKRTAEAKLTEQKNKVYLDFADKTPIEVVKEPTTKLSPVKTTGEVLYTKGRSDFSLYFQNAGADTKLYNSKNEVYKDYAGVFHSVYAADKESGNNDRKFPPNLFIALIEKSGDRCQSIKQETDLIDRDGNRILKDNRITQILHIYSDFFILTYGDYYSYCPDGNSVKAERGAIYNSKTKAVYEITPHPQAWGFSFNFNFVTAIDKDSNYSKYLNQTVGRDGWLGYTFSECRIDEGYIYKYYYIDKEGKLATTDWISHAVFTNW
jgi:hypothetical protein